MNFIFTRNFIKFRITSGIDFLTLKITQIRVVTNDNVNW